MDTTGMRPETWAIAGELSAAPGDGGRPIHEWIEVRPFLEAAPPAKE